MFLIILFSKALSAGSGIRCEHPRPDLMRSDWQCLNGEWEFQIDPKGIGEKENWWQKEHLERKIIVPFEVESGLSGIGTKAEAENFWYLKRFKVDGDLKSGGRIILHFEAVDYQAWVWLNGNYLGTHLGGYTPFSFEITDLVKDENILVVRVYDSGEQRQVRGKQSSTGRGYGIWYKPASGIWQTVWLERVGESYVKSFKYYFERISGEVNFELNIDGASEEKIFSLMGFAPDGKELKTGIKDIPLAEKVDFSWKIDEPLLWSADNPVLYRVKFMISDERGEKVDEVESYLGLREVEVKDGGVWLNGERIYQKLVLVQGYFGSGNYSPEADEEFSRDLILLKEMGFNGLRLHQKVEAKRFYYWADRLGVLIWQDMPGMCTEPKRMFLPAGKEWRERFEKEWQEVIENHFNHPSIIVWVPFNESWGILPEIYSPVINRWAIEVVRLTKELDSHRLLVDNSGWHHRETDILDVHHYLDSVEKSKRIYEKLENPWGTYSMILSSLGLLARGLPMMSPLFRGVKYQGEPIVISEYGGFGFYKTEAKGLLDNYRDYTLAIGKYRYLQGYCYTQLYDVEQEKNGLLDEFRNPKVSIEEVKKINAQIGNN